MANLEVIRAGKAAKLVWRLTQSIPPPTVTYDPPTPPTITIFDPTGAMQVTAQAMTKVLSGLYSYTYATPSGGPLGTWSAYVDATDGNGANSGSVDAVDQLKATPVFILV